MIKQGEIDKKEFAAKEKLEIVQSERVASAGGRKGGLGGIPPALQILGEISSNFFKRTPPVGKSEVWLALCEGSPADFRRKIEFFVFQNESNTILILCYQNFEDMASDKNTIGDNIKKLRAKLNLTQDDLARKSDVKYTTLSKIESGVVTKQTVHIMAKIAKALNVSIENLIK